MGEVRDRCAWRPSSLRAQAAERLAELERARARARAARDLAVAGRAARSSRPRRSAASRSASCALARWVERARGVLEQLAPRPRPSAGARSARPRRGPAAPRSPTAARAFLARLKKGELVWLPRFKKRCQVTRIFKEQRARLNVRLGPRELRSRSTTSRSTRACSGRGRGSRSGRRTGACRGSLRRAAAQAASARRSRAPSRSGASARPFLRRGCLRLTARSARAAIERWRCAGPRRGSPTVRR